MELQNMDLRGGSLQISTEVLGKIARCAALEVAGVAEVSCGSQMTNVTVSRVDLVIAGLAPAQDAAID